MPRSPLALIIVAYLCLVPVLGKEVADQLRGMANRKPLPTIIEPNGIQDRTIVGDSYAIDDHDMSVKEVKNKKKDGSICVRG